MIYLLSSAGLGIILGLFNAKYQKALIPMLVLLIPTLFLIYRDSEVLLHRFPEEAHDILLPVILIIAWMVSWIVIRFMSLFSRETTTQRKKRILKDYGYKNGMPY